MKVLQRTANCSTASRRDGRRSSPVSRACSSPAMHWRSRLPCSISPASRNDENLSEGTVRDEYRELQARELQANDGLYHLHRLHAGEGVGGADLNRIQPKLFLRQ